MPPIGSGWVLPFPFQKSLLEMWNVFTPTLPPEVTPTSPLPRSAVLGILVEIEPLYFWSVHWPVIADSFA
ncbi:hypothetical protein OG948_57945 (plasmid) [Embleya sp. NBC_00888]|uniref:hypothetical protein n=1 Tax=Embleya sp. NBC_00888 TaxID=2975960 RepID=UPI003865FA26|nr:hypothetical protein OG948_57945 [Embleya sp. NBC_00888]